MSKRLSILIPTLSNRSHYLERLLEILNPQADSSIEILIQKDDGEKSIGEKRNILLDKATGDYIAFVDDDDLVSNDYCPKIITALESEPDVVGIHLHHYEDFNLRGLTYHSLRYDSWWQEQNKEDPSLTNYYRNPNHLNPVKREYALVTKFPLISMAEDKDYSRRLLTHLKTEEYIEDPIYFYLFRTNK